MNKIYTCLLMASTLTTVLASAETRYAGGDISLLPEYINAGAIYKDHNGQEITDFLPWCKEQGMNAMRVRLFVNPELYKSKHQNDSNSDTKYDPNACQDLEYIIPLCQDIVNAGLELMLDFHYSDTWADPAKQWTPIEWEGMSDDELCKMIYSYTHETLEVLKDNGVTPSFIQTGNEISYGMLWGALGSSTSSLDKVYTNSTANWSRFANLLDNAITACREVCPDAKIIIHTERVALPSVLTAFYEKLDNLGVDYDIIGLSYYPIWHGNMTMLDTALTALESQFPTKNIMIVETGYGLLWQLAGTVTYNVTNVWPISEAGQAKFAQGMVDTLEQHESVNGLFWWWMEYNPYNTNLSGWYNGPLFNPQTGCASSAFEIICSFSKDDSGSVTSITADPSAPTQWYDLMGRPTTLDTPGLKISPSTKVRY